MIAQADLDHCEAAIRHGSLSFHAASRLLPDDVRRPALALYAFCRLADDAVDLQADKRRAVDDLHDRLDRVYRGQPRNAAADRAFAGLVAAYEMPRALPQALLEGFVWDSEGRRYASLSDLHAYSARVAATVGAMMCVLMRVRDADALARACDLGLAMQLTNIARDVGEDAAEGRLFLPLDWFAEAGLDPEAFLADPHARPEIRRMTRRLLAEAERLYFRSEAGIASLPLACRPGIYAARLIYGAIGHELARLGHDNINNRARTCRRKKAVKLAGALGRTALSLIAPRSPVLYAGAHPQAAFLVEAAARVPPARETFALGHQGSMAAVLAKLAAQDRPRRSSLIREPARPT